jgi:hypothetical protein
VSESDSPSSALIEGTEKGNGRGASSCGSFKSSERR